MANETLEKTVAQLRKRVKLLESEVRVLTPPMVELERGLMEFRTEVNQRFSESRVEVFHQFQRVDGGLGTIDQRLNTIDRKLDEVISVMKDSFSAD